MTNITRNPSRRNSPEEIRKWYKKTLAESTLDQELKTELADIAEKEIGEGGWRGDVSDNWRMYSGLVTTATVPGLYP